MDAVIKLRVLFFIMELIKISNNGYTDIVSARELHLFLEVKTDFTDWAKRMFEYGFEEYVDYSLLKIGEGSAHNKIDYALTIDCAKEMSMLQRSEKGKLARKYFIECEKKLNHSLPQTFSQALMLAAQQAAKIEQQQKEIEASKPKVDFYDQVTGSKDSFDMADVAKVCNLGIGRNRLFKFLRDIRVIRENNTPYQQYVDCGYFRVIESKYNKPDGSVNISLKTVVYQKGIDYIIKQYKQLS